MSIAEGARSANSVLASNWRPSSAVIQPNVFATNGSGNINMMIHISQFDVYSQPRQSQNTAATITAMKIVPRPTMIWKL